MAKPGTGKVYERYAWTLLFLVGLFTLAFGALFLIAPLQTPIPQDALEGAGENWTALVASNSWLVGYTETLLRFTGSFTLGLGFLGLIITWKGFRKGERWAWYSLWYYPPLFLFHTVLASGSSSGIALNVSLLVISSLGLLIPYRIFFPK